VIIRLIDRKKVLVKRIGYHSMNLLILTIIFSLYMSNNLSIINTISQEIDIFCQEINIMPNYIIEGFNF